jgi:hypothetical protein
MEKDREMERGFRTSVRTSFGGSKDKQGWDEIKQGINIGDPYQDGFYNSGSFSRVRKHVHEVSTQEFSTSKSTHLSQSHRYPS